MSDRITPIFFGEMTEEGKIHFETEERRRQWTVWIDRLKGKKIQISIQKRKTKRSLKQNSYLWVCLKVLEQELGQPDRDIYDYLIDKHAPMAIMDLNGRQVEKRKSSSQFSVGEMVEFMMHVKVFAADFGVILPEPDQYDPAVLLSE